MKMFLRVSSILLCIAIVTSSSVFAASDKSNGNVLTSINDQYNRYTIDFNHNSEIQNSITSTVSSSVADRVALARNYVLSLNLDDAGYSYIEDSCLSQLDQMLENDVLLASYSVLIPKTARGVLTYYGTYNGRTYYSQYYSSYTREISLTSDTKKESNGAWDDWLQNGAELILSVVLEAGEELLLPVASDIFSAVVGIDSPFEIHDDAYFEGLTVLESQCRGIYTYDDKLHFGNDKDALIMMMHDETGVATVYLTFHPVDPSSPQASYQFYKSPAQLVNTYQFGNSDSNMSACNIFYNRGEGPIRYTLLPMAFRLTWESI